jgi:hypothetical protein
MLHKLLSSLPLLEIPAIAAALLAPPSVYVPNKYKALSAGIEDVHPVVLMKAVVLIYEVVNGTSAMRWTTRC